MRSLITIAALATTFIFAEASDADFYKYTNYNPDAAESSINFADFAVPKGKSRVQTWWHWINANVSREGIERDLKAMGENNYGAAIIFNVSSGSTPEGSLKFNSPEWFDNFRFVVDTAKKYNMEIGIHNCDGWSEAGGPWITPELSMKKLSWSRMRAKGNGSKQTFKLPKPPSIKNYYEDIAVVAYPAFRPESIAVEKHVKGIKPATPDTKILSKNWKNLFDERNDTYFTAVATKEKYDGFGIDIELDEPFEASSISLDLKWTWKLPEGTYLAVSDDGKKYRKLCDLKFGSFSLHQKFPRTKSKYWRIMREKAYGVYQMSFNIASLELLREGQFPKSAPFITGLRQKVAAQKHNRAMPYDDTPVPPEVVIKPSDIKVFTAKIKDGGEFEWKVPQGEWEIVRVGYTTNGVGVHPASPSGRGLESDKLSAEATDFHFDSYIAKMIDAAGGEAGKTFKYVETDSWECGAQNWTRDMQREFKKLNGYDLMKYLPVLLGEVVESKEATEKFAADFRATTSHLVMKNFYGRLGERIRERGLMYESEPLTEASLNDQIEIFKHTDIPQNEVWQDYRNLKNVRVPEPATPNFAVCASRFFGKTMTTCESLTQVQGNWADSPLVLKGKIDTILLSGMNAIVFHSYTHQPDERVPGWQMEPWGSCINRKMPWFNLARGFFDYISRSQYLLQQGKPDIHVLRLLGEEIPVLGGLPNLERGYFSARMNADCLKNYLRVEDGKFVSPGRIKFDMLEVAPDAVFKADTLAALKKMAEEGGIVCGSKLKTYRTNKGGAEDEARWSQLNGEIFGDGSKNILQIGKGKVFVGYSANETLAKLGVKKAFITDRNDIAVRKREHADGTVWYYVASCSGVDKTFDISFDTVGKNVEIWNPETAEKTAVYTLAEEGGYTTIPMKLRRNDSMFVVFSGERKSPAVSEVSLDGKKVFPNAKTLDFVDEKSPNISIDASGKLSVEFFKGGTVEVAYSNGKSALASVSGVRSPIKIKTPFIVEFQEKFDAPKTAEFKDFISWTEHSDVRVKNYSGIGVYKLEFDFSDAAKLAKNERAYLKFDNIMEIGRVKVNGKLIGTLWKKPFVLDITAYIVNGANRIEVEVGNTWVNRCLYDASLPAEKRVTWANTMNFHFPPKGQKALPNQGLDKSWKQGAIPSGIIGPVRVEFSLVN